jgi:ABC-2 type transport system ATP-binding protein
LKEVGCGEPTADRRTSHITVPVQDGANVLVDAVRALDKARVRIGDLSLHRPSLDDVFFALTGKPAEADGNGQVVGGDGEAATGDGGGAGKRRRTRSKA